MVTCTRCGDWWFCGATRLCPACVAIATSDDTDHGDEHVDSIADSEVLHARKIPHRTRECRVCIGAGAPLRPDVRWTGAST